MWNGGAVTRRGYDLRTNRLTVAERAGSPVVGELVATNAGPRPVLLLEGELLEGGQQHRVAARTVVVPAQGSVVLDVRCVEAGRWSGNDRHSRGGRRAPMRVRARSNPSQQEVWDEVGRVRHAYGAGPTASLLDATRSVEDAAAELVRDLRPLPFQSGLLVGIAGQPLLLEVFDSPRTLAHAWRHLLNAVALDAVGLPPVPTPGRRARRFLDRLGSVEATTGADAGAGRQLVGASPYAEVAMTTWSDRVLHEVAVNPRHGLVNA